MVIIFVAQQSKSGLSFLIVDVLRPHTFRHTRTRQDSSERVISPSQRSLTTQQTQETNIHAPSGIRTCDSINPAVAYVLLRPHSHGIDSIDSNLYSCDIFSVLSALIN
jgi:hypothetical protein